jgi:hypothetical protein
VEVADLDPLAALLSSRHDEVPNRKVHSLRQGGRAEDELAEALFDRVLDRKTHAVRGVPMVRERTDLCRTGSSRTGSKIPLVKKGEAFHLGTIRDCDGHRYREPTSCHVNEGLAEACRCILSPAEDRDRTVSNQREPQV